MRRDKEEKRRVQEALHRIMDSGIELTEVADLTGLDYELLRNFSSKKMTINPENFDALKKWVDAKTASQNDVEVARNAENIEAIRARLSEVVGICTEELDVLLKALHSTYPDETKFRKLFAWIEGNQGLLSAIRKGLDEGK